MEFLPYYLAHSCCAWLKSILFVLIIFVRCLSLLLFTGRGWWYLRNVLNDVWEPVIPPPTMLRDNSGWQYVVCKRYSNWPLAVTFVNLCIFSVSGEIQCFGSFVGPTHSKTAFFLFFKGTAKLNIPLFFSFQVGMKNSWMKMKCNQVVSTDWISLPREPFHAEI